MDVLFLEDLVPGQVYSSGSVEVTAEAIKRFAAEYDPQYFHVDEEAARDSFFNGLAASGWHTAALTMRLLVDSELKLAGGLIGAGVEEIRWFRPVRPGDVLTVKAEIVETRPLRSKPGFGLARVRVTTYDAAGEPVQVFTSAQVVPSRG